MSLTPQQRVAFDPPKWEPEQGEAIYGEIASIKWLDSSKGAGTYSVIKIVTDAETMQGWRVSMGAVQDRELRDQHAQVGDKIAIAFLGMATRRAGGNPYKNLEVAVEKAVADADA